MDREAYYAEAKDWGYEKYIAEKSAKKRWIAISFLILLLAIVALGVQAFTLATMPTKIEKVPFLVKENIQTGEISDIKQFNHMDWKPSNVTEEYFVGKYVNARERFDKRTLDEDYIDVQLFSSQEVADDYVLKMSGEEGESKGVIEYFKKSPGEREVFIKSISWLDRNVSQVRFSTKDKLEIKTKKPEKRHYSAIIEYEFTEEAVPEDEQYIRRNLVGFHVSKYTRTTESIQSWER